MLVDDHLLFREGLKKLFEVEEGVEIVAEASSGEEAMKLCKNIDVDLILMDISMPGLGGIKAIREIKRMRPGIKIIALTMHDEEAYREEAMRAGVSAYVVKGVGASELIKAIERVCGQAGRKRHLSSLTPRERDVLSLIAKGKNNKEIAHELRLKEKTVRNYVSNILQKLGVRDRTQAVILVLKEGMRFGKEDKGSDSG